MRRRGAKLVGILILLCTTPSLSATSVALRSPAISASVAVALTRRLPSCAASLTRSFRAPANLRGGGEDLLGGRVAEGLSGLGATSRATSRATMATDCQSLGGFLAASRQAAADLLAQGSGGSDKLLLVRSTTPGEHAKLKDVSVHHFSSLFPNPWIDPRKRVQQGKESRRSEKKIYRRGIHSGR